MCCLVQAVRFTDLGKSGVQLLGGSDSPSHFWNGWSKGMRGQGTKGASAPSFLLSQHYRRAGGGERKATGYKSAAKGERRKYDYQTSSPLPLEG